MKAKKSVYSQTTVAASIQSVFLIATRERCKRLWNNYYDCKSDLFKLLLLKEVIYFFIIRYKIPLLARTRKICSTNKHLSRYSF